MIFCLEKPDIIEPSGILLKKYEWNTVLKIFSNFFHDISFLVFFITTFFTVFLV